MSPAELASLHHPASTQASMAMLPTLWDVLQAWRKAPDDSPEYDVGAGHIKGLIEDMLADQLMAGRRDAHEFKVNLMAENLRLRATLAAGPWQQMDDLAALARRLVHALAGAAPEHLMVRQAMDYLQRKGLQAAPLRCPAVAPAAIPAVGGR